MKFLIGLLVFITCVVVLSAKSTANKTEARRYDNYKVYRFTPVTEEQRDILFRLNEEAGVNFWKEVGAIGQPIDIMFSPHLQKSTLTTLQRSGISLNEIVENVQKLIDDENEDMLQVKSSRLTWTNYHSTESIYEFLDEQAATHPTVASVISVGKSYERRSIRLIKIAKGGLSKPIIWLDANFHAREWITNAVATYIINQLLNSKDPKTIQLATDFVWYIMPIANPDGYEFSRNTDRFWRKTRSNTSNENCQGVDPNRNWGFHWNETGSSADPCSEIFAGPKAFSEPEVKQTAEFISTIADKMVLYLSLHSYSQLFILPYGYTTVKIKEYDEYIRIANLAAQAIFDRYGTVFNATSTADGMYASSGSSLDWVKGTYNTKLGYGIELQDTGLYGFILPSRLILQSSLEFFDGLHVLATEVQKSHLNQ